MAFLVEGRKDDGSFTDRFRGACNKELEASKIEEKGVVLCFYQKTYVP